MTWVPNGWGAGTDNSAAGGGGGFTAIPQPANPANVIGPEQNGQFEPLNFTYSSAVIPAQGNYFTIFNPGRQG